MELVQRGLWKDELVGLDINVQLLLLKVRKQRLEALLVHKRRWVGFESDVEQLLRAAMVFDICGGAQVKTDGSGGEATGPLGQCAESEPTSMNKIPQVTS